MIVDPYSDPHGFMVHPKNQEFSNLGLKSGHIELIQKLLNWQLPRVSVSSSLLVSLNQILLSMSPLEELFCNCFAYLSCSPGILLAQPANCLVGSLLGKRLCPRLGPRKLGDRRNHLAGGQWQKGLEEEQNNFLWNRSSRTKSG